MELKKFDFEGLELRTSVDAEDQAWFAAIDVCGILDIKNTTQAVEDLEEDEKKLDYVIDKSGQQRQAWLINEFGLYSLILNSRKPEAKLFKKWITHEVLPSIRKAGKYTNEEERDREESIQILVSEIEKLIFNRDDLREKANKKTKEIDIKNSQLMQLLKSDFRQTKINFLV